MSALDLISRTARGRIFVINLYEAVVSSPPSIDSTHFRKNVWDPLRMSLGPRETPRRALIALFNFLHDPKNRHLRFSGPGHPPSGGAFDVYTTTRAEEMLYDDAKRVVKLGAVQVRLNRAAETDPWTARQARTLSLSLKDPHFLNGRKYGQTYDIFWATPDPACRALDADTLRDQLGLVHIDKEQWVLQLHFHFSSRGPGVARGPTWCCRPTIIEATDHRRFKARPPSTGYRSAATAADLERLRRAGAIQDGFEEIVISAVPMSALQDARYVGYTAEHADMITAAPSSITMSRSDRLYAKAIEPAVGFATVMTTLKAALE